jgi:hypothetical protein
MRLNWFLILLPVITLPLIAEEDPLDRLGQDLAFAAFDDSFRGKFSGNLDIEGYRVEQPSPGLVFTREHEVFNPRLTLALDVRWGPHVYGYAAAAGDKGFNPGSQKPGFRSREYFVRFTPDDDGRVSLQVGKFANVIGNWVARHTSWENPFITAPLPYENVTAISDIEGPSSAAEFVAPFVAGEKYEYNPILWGPGYASGASLGGKLGKFDYAFEVKNTGPASRPESWTVERVGFSQPSLNVRVGFRPDVRWNLGFSASDSAYLLPVAAPTLPAGHDRGDYRERLLGQDIGFEWHHLQVWAELYESEFDVPRVGLARSVAGYIETKYKITPQFFGALRINRQVFSDVSTPAGEVPWGADIWRQDVAAGYRFTPHTQLKLQVSFESADGAAGRANYAGQFIVRF